MLINPFISKKYLVIDDFGEMRNMIKGLLRTLGASDIDSARNGVEALELIEATPYDVILCDYNLGEGKNGQQLLEEVRHRKMIDLSAVFIMITAENTRDMVMAAVEYEPDSYLSKPFNKELLGTRLTKLFELKHSLLPLYDALKRNDYQRALAWLEKTIASKPKNLPHLIRLRADICYDADQFDQAGKYYRQILSAREVPWARLGLGKVLYHEKSYAEATETFQYLIQHSPTLMSAYDWLAKCQRALGQTKEAQQTLQTAVKLSPRVINRQQTLGELAMHNNDYNLAAETLGKAARLGRHSVYNNPKLHANLAKSQSAIGQHNDALKVIAGINKLFNATEADFFALNAEAEVKLNQGDQAAADACLNKASELLQSNRSLTSPEAALELARTSARLGHADDAKALLDTAIRNNHDNEEFLARTAELYMESGFSDDAAATVKAISQEVVQMNNQGVRLIAQNQFAEAIALFTQAADSLPNNIVINLNAARALILFVEKSGEPGENLNKARHYIDRVRHIAPKDHRLVPVLKRYIKLSSR